MATMKQVAERAGVSTSTVSHVINNTRAVSAAARTRVLAIIDELRYIPSAVARSLKSDKTRTFGLVVPDNTIPCFAELIRGIEDAAFRSGYNILLCNGGEDPARQAGHLRALGGGRIDGMVVVAGGARATLGALLEQHIPTVVAAHEMAGIEADFIGLDHEGAGYLAARHLIDLGHRSIACICGPCDQPPGRERVDGCLRALEEAGLALVTDCVQEEPTSEGGVAACKRLLALPQRPTAIFASNDLMALGVLCAAAEAGVRVPEALSVVGCDNIPAALYASPRLTTVAQPYHRMGELVAEALLARIDGDGGPPRRELLQGALVVRQSTSPPAA